MATNVLEQIQRLEDRIQKTLEAARTIASEKAALEKDLEALRRRLGESEGARQEASDLKGRMEALERENRDLKAEREEVRRRVDGMIAALGQIDAMAEASAVPAKA